MSDEDIMFDSRNSDAFSGGFGDDFSSGGGASFDFGGDSLDGGGDPFASSGGDPFGDPFASSGDPFSNGGGDPFASSGGFGDNSFGGFGDTSSSGFDSLGGINLGGNAGGLTQTQPDHMDKAIDALFEGAAGGWEVTKLVFKSFKNRNVDDWAHYCSVLMYTSLAGIGIGTVLGLVGTFGNLKLLHFTGMPLNMILSCGLGIGTSLIGLGGAAFKLLGIDDSADLPNENNFQSLGDENSDELLSGLDSDSFSNLDDNTDDYGNDFDDIFSSLLDDEDNKDSGDDIIGSVGDDTTEDEKETNVDDNGFLDSLMDRGVKDVGVLDNVQSNVPIIDRKLLFDLFTRPNFFKVLKPDFSSIKTYDTDDTLFRDADMRISNAYAAAAGKDLAEVVGESAQAHLDSMSESMFCYRFKFSRVNKFRVTPSKLAEELKSFFADFNVAEKRDSSEINAGVELDGKFYSITISKPIGKDDIITVGDCLLNDKNKEFFLNEKNMLPMIAGISEIGEPIIIDAKDYETTMIVGKSRSGKSWFVSSTVMQLQAFNTPEDVQFLYIDPKDSELFKSLALMPHCCGLHKHNMTLEIMNDLIDKEAPRRKKLLGDNHCDTIWELRKKGIKIPILYLVIDEYLTIYDYYEDRQSELASKMKVIITQFPSLGIRLFFVTHRAQGAVDKTIRVNIQFAAAVRATDEVVKETLDIKKWDRTLPYPGDTAARFGDKLMYMRGVAIETDDSANNALIRNMAKAFYKMGVDIPDMSTIGIGYNRDEDAIREQLEVDSGNSYEVQYDATKVKSELDNIY